MVERALLLRDRIDSFCIEYVDSIYGASAKIRRAVTAEDREFLLTLSRKDWLALAKVASIVKKFFMLTKPVEGSRITFDRGVLSDFKITLKELLAHVRTLRDDYQMKMSIEYPTPSNEYL
ncbi:hypothetical protein IFR04_012763 [Cadophora malorum]|uniref:Uncharacterized protein n=1 Tax=Cadophora malorum TaxID=108018 RepID=A0A8H7T889_9HELO|nr:hypothetical protein IFR04_012763 [Cadophora malorum]